MRLWHVWVAFVAMVIGFVGFAVWDDAQCAEWGPPAGSTVIMSCGTNCWFAKQVDVKRCTRRKP